MDILIKTNTITKLPLSKKYVEEDVNIITEIPASSTDTTFEDELLNGTFSREYTNNRVTVLRSNCFYELRSFLGFSSTSVTDITGSTFYYCSSLEYCHMPNLERINSSYNWSDCSKLKRLEFPKLTGGFGTSNCRSCSMLEYINLGKIEVISSYAFLDCSNLKYLILARDTDVVRLDNVNAFQRSSIANGTGFVYVPDDLVEAYKIATNWSTYADQIKPLSELPEGV